MNLFYDSRKITTERIIWHVVFWISYLLFYGSVHGGIVHDYIQTYIEVSIYMPVRMAATYFTVYILVVKYLQKRRYVGFAVLFIISVAVFGFIQRWIYYYITFPRYRPEYLDDPFIYWPMIFKGVINLYTIVAIAAAIKLWKQWYRNQQTNQNLEKQKLEAELKLLRAQIHPHFLFNTLNNLYALTLKKSDKAPEIVLKLSELLNYMLYECNAPKVSLEKEVKLIKDYIDLEKLRYGERLNVKTEIKGNIIGIQIAPMLILPFVENSFKHGVSVNLENPFVNIKLSVDNYQLSLIVENSKEIADEKDNRGYKEGIGLKNVKRRLELLYNSNYSLNIFDMKDRFRIELEVSINPNN